MSSDSGSDRSMLVFILCLTSALLGLYTLEAFLIIDCALANFIWLLRNTMKQL
jgi:hypothetical protein